MSDPSVAKDGAPAEDPPSALIGQTIRDRYRVESLLGTGGMGSVYRVTHLPTSEPMAVKVLSRKRMRNPNIVARFEREAQAAASFGHPHVAASTDFGRLEDGRCFLVMEYVDGKELRGIIDEARGPLPPVRAFHIARQIATALSRAHKLGIVHRDLKPENIMIVKREGQDFVKVLDFGLALVSRHLSSSGSSDDEHTVSTAPKITQVGEIFGTPEYMAPEQTASTTDIRTDLYALGILLYEMLTGLRPFVGKNTVAVIQQQLVTPPPPMKDRAPSAQISADMEALVIRLLAKLPEERYQTPDELIKAIDQIGAAHNLAWPGSASASNPAVSGAVSGISAREPLPLANLWEQLRDKLFAKPRPKSTLGKALDAIQNRLDRRARAARRRRLFLVGAGLVVVLLAGIVWSVLRR